jgi:hypothetical protein
VVKTSEGAGIAPYERERPEPSVEVDDRAASTPRRPLRGVPFLERLRSVL